MGAHSFILLVTAFTLSVATHYRFGNVAWRPTGGRGVTFDISLGWRRSFGWSPRYPNVGNSIRCGTWYLGDGKSLSINALKITSQDNSEDWVVGTQSFQHTYSSVNNGNRPFVAYFTGGNRISTLRNNRDRRWRLETTVDLQIWPGTTWINTSPASNGLPIVSVVAGKSNSWLVPANDADGDKLTFRLATREEMIGSSWNGQPPGLSVDTNTGRIQWSVPNDPGALYCAAVVISDGRSKIMIDFILKLIQPKKVCLGCGSGTCRFCTSNSQCGGCSGGCGDNEPPKFVLPSPFPSIPGASQLPTCFVPNQATSFTLKAQDDACDTIFITSSGLPNGASIGRVGSSQNPVTSRFQWTPSPSQAGTTPVCFTASDNRGAVSPQECVSLFVPSTSAGTPTVSSNSPNRGEVGGGTAVVIRGSNFARGNGLRCRFNGDSSGSVQAVWVSASEIICVTPPKTGSSNTLRIDMSNLASCDQWVTVTTNFQYYSACDAGSFMNGNGGCADCPIGRYLAGGSVSPSNCELCPAGTYGAVEGLNSASCSGNCLRGYYCPAGSTSATQFRCPAGKYGSTTGLQDSACSGACSPGFYCEAGSTSSQDKPCSAGRYGGPQQQTADCAGPCEAGYFCTAGSSSSKQNQCGAVDQYCPEGSGISLPVGTGYYSTGGTATTRTSQEECEPGHYCTDGNRYPCPAGRFGSVPGLQSSLCEGACQAGYYCAAGSASATAENCAPSGSSSPATYYCPQGTATRLQIGAGEFTLPVEAPVTNRQGKQTCGADFFCPGDGTIRRRVEFVSGCPSGAVTVQWDENVSAGLPATLAAVRARSNVPGATIDFTNVISVTPTPRSTCNTPIPFSFQDSGDTLTVSMTNAVNYELCNSYRLEIAAMAGSYTRTCVMTVSIVDKNDAPELSASYSFTIDENSVVNSIVSTGLAKSDEDFGQELSFELTGPTASLDRFKISACGGVISVKKDQPPLNFEQSGGDGSPRCAGEGTSYSMTVKLTDDGSPPASTTAPLTITVNDVDEQPFWAKETALDLQVNENSVAAVVDVGSDKQLLAYDCDASTTLQYSLVRDDSGLFEVVAATGVIQLKAGQSLNFESQNAYTMEVGVTDSTTARLTRSVTVQVVDLNDKPVVPDTEVTIAENPVANLLVAVLRAHDDDIGASVTVTIESGNDSGAFKIVSTGALVNELRVDTTAAVNYEVTPKFTLGMKVRDAGHLSLPAQETTFTVTVNVRDVNEKPTIVAGQTRDVPENSALQTAVGTPLSASDPDGNQQLFFSIVSGHDGRFSISPAGQLMVAGALDTETKGSYSITVRVVDNGSPPQQDETTVLVTVTNVNEAPVVTPGQSFSLQENPAKDDVVGTVVATDVDVSTGDTASLSFAILTGPDSDQFAIVATGSNYGQLTVANSPNTLDFERTTQIVLTIEATDTGGLKGQQTVVIQLTNQNEAPQFPHPDAVLDGGSPSAVQRGIMEQTSGVVGARVQGFDVDDGDTQRLVYSIESVTASDSTWQASSFVINAQTGQISSTTAVQAFPDPFPPAKQYNGEDRIAYDVKVRVTDPGGLFGEGWVRIDVIESNIAPVLNDQVFQVAENLKPGSQIAASLGATDANIPATTQKLFYTLVGVTPASGMGLFTLQRNAPGKLSLASRGLDYESMQPFGFKYYLEVVVEDDGPGRLQDTANITIELTDVNESPRLESNAFTILETASGSEVVGAVAMADEDFGQSHTWVVTAAAGTMPTGTLPFEVDNSGVIRVKAAIPQDGGSASDGPVIDHELYSTFSLVVTATDNGSPTITGTTNVLVTVTDVNELPYTTAAPYSFSVNENAATGTVLGTVAAADPDDSAEPFGRLTWSITDGNHNNTFRIDATSGVLSTQGSVDYEDVEAFSLTIRVQDAGEPAKGIDVPVQVTVVDQPDAAIDTLSGALQSGTLGGETVYFSGQDLGYTSWHTHLFSKASVVAATYVNKDGVQYTATNCHQTIPNTQVACDTVPGVGVVRWTVTVNGQVMAVNTTTRYQTPAITGTANDDNMATMGGTQISITGTNFGPVGTVAKVTYTTGGVVYTAAECATTTASTTVSCKNVPGVGVEMTWTVEVGRQMSAGFIKAESSYAASTITAAEISGQPAGTRWTTHGGQTITITGTNFGPPSTAPARIAVAMGRSDQLEDEAGKYSFRGCQVTVADVRLVCTSPAGIGAGHAVRATLGNRRGVAGGSVTYRLPFITGVTGAGAHRASTMGDEVVEIAGDQFGPVGDTPLPIITYGPGAARYIAAACRVTTAHTRITCLTVEGTGANHSWAVVVDGQANARPFPAGTSYHPPVLSFFEGAVVSPAVGGSTVLVNGVQFGPAGHNRLDYAQYSRASNMSHVFGADCWVVSHTQLNCTTSPGTGRDLVWKVVVDGQLSEEPSTEYADPLVTAVTLLDGYGLLGERLQADGGQTVRLSGLNFGPTSLSGVLDWVQYGASTLAQRAGISSTDIRAGDFSVTLLDLAYTASNCSHVSHTELVCTTVPGTGRDMHWLASVQGQSGAAPSPSFGYASPQVLTFASPVNATTPGNMYTAGGGVLSLYGTNMPFADSSSTVSVRFGSRMLTPTNRWDFTDVDFVRSTFAAGPAAYPHVHEVRTGAPALHRADFVLPEGFGTGIELALVVEAHGETFETPVLRFNYSEPFISGISAAKERGAPSNMIVNIGGSSFCNPASAGMMGCGRVQIRDPGASAWEQVQPENVLVYGHDKITVRLIGTQDRQMRVVVGPAVDSPEGDVGGGYVRVTEVRRVSGQAPQISSRSMEQLQTARFRTAGGDELVLDSQFICEDTDIKVLMLNTIGSSTTTKQCTDVQQPVPSPTDAIPPGEDPITFCRISCKVPAGEGYNHQVVIDRGDQTSNTSANLKLIYHLPLVTSIQVTDPVSGALVDASHFFPAPNATVGGFAVSTAARYIESPTAWPNRINWRAPSPAEYSPYDLLVTVPTSGGRIVLTGDNFGTFAAENVYRVGDADRIRSTFAEMYPEAVRRRDNPVIGTYDPFRVGSGAYASEHGHTAMTLDMPEGSGRGHFMILQVADQRAPQYIGVDFEPPVVTGLRLAEDSSVSSVVRPRTIGGQRLVISGRNLGNPAATSGFGKFAAPTVTVSVGTLPCVLDNTHPAFAPHTSLVCIVPPAEGTAHPVLVTVDGQRSCSNSSTVTPGADYVAGDEPPPACTAMIDYLAPEVTSVSAATGRTNGGDVLVLYGDNFGVAIPTVRFASTRGAADMDYFVARMNASTPVQGASEGFGEGIILSHNHTTIVLLYPEGQGGARQLQVITGGQSSTLKSSVSFSYSPPAITDARPLLGPTDGFVVQLLGSNFGRVEVEPAGFKKTSNLGIVVKVAPQAAETTDPSGVTIGSTTYDPDMLVECRRVRQTELSVAMQAWTYVDPITQTRPTFTEAYSHTHVFCYIPSGFGRDLRLLVSLDGVDAETEFLFDYSPPSFTQVMPNNPFGHETTPLAVLGQNFGSTAGVFGKIQNPVAIGFNGYECSFAEVIGSRRLECVSNASLHTVGEKYMNLSVASYDNIIFPITPSAPMSVVCDKNYYGQPGEFCIACPKGALCERSKCVVSTPTGSCEEYQEPVSIAGFWRLYLNTNETIGTASCPEGRTNRPGRFAGECPIFVPCEPVEACVGNNECATGYTGERCLQCVRGEYYRVSGECVKCPSVAWLLILIAILALALMLALAYILNSRGLHLAFLSIGVDYFQVLAIFARSKVAWPSYVTSLLNAMSVFNVNLELVAPECTVPDTTYATKWTVSMMIPLVFWACVAIVWGAVWVYLHVRGLRGSKRNAHGPAMFGMGLIGFYYLYLFLTRMTFDIFNCNPTDPPDGFEYLEPDPATKCWQSGGVHMQLFAGAVVTAIVYTLGFPVLVGLVLQRNKEAVKTDQILRALGIGDDEFTNPRYFRFRRMWHKMYYHFKPGKWYWILLIIARKFLIAVTSLLYRRTPAFQLASAFLVLFAAYVLQVRGQPFMSMSERRAVIAHHMEKVKQKNKLHMAIASSYEAYAATVATRKQANAKTMEAIMQAKPGRVPEFVVDYNFVEAVLLFSAMIVCLSGIMFQTGQFNQYAYGNQDLLIGTIVMLVIILSLVFYVAVFFAEIFTVFGWQVPGWCLCTCLRRKRGADTGRKRGVSELLDPASGATTGTMMNPMMKQANDSDERAARERSEALMALLGNDLVPTPSEWAVVQQEAARLDNTEENLRADVESYKARLTTSSVREEAADDMTPAVAAARQVAATHGMNKGWRAGVRAGTRPTSRKLVAGARLRAASSKDAAQAQAAEPAASSPDTTEPAKQATPGAWNAYVDPASGHTYYVNSATNETSWTLPAGSDAAKQPEDDQAALTAHSGEADDTFDVPADAPSDSWVAQDHPASGAQYFVNQRTRRSTWTNRG